MRTITKKELVNRIADKTGQTKVVAKEIIQAFLDAIIDELAAGNRLEFREFGVFETKERAARRAQNPRTLQKVDVPAKRIVKFKVGRMMRKRVSGDDDDPQIDQPGGGTTGAGGQPGSGEATTAGTEVPAASDVRPGNGSAEDASGSAARGEAAAGGQSDS
jgi:integration host factor subunit beta